jgi:hypothetical protein
VQILACTAYCFRKGVMRFALGLLPMDVPAVKPRQADAFLYLAKNCSFLNQKQSFAILNGFFSEFGK